MAQKRPRAPQDPSPRIRQVWGRKLLAWGKKHPRKLPWRGEEDPYKIWVSEVLLQQTRTDQAGPFYNKFIQKFPTVKALAAAKTDDVLKAWEGAGYYARARNLHKAAQLISEKYGGKLPPNYADLRALPGFGPYTTAAVLSLAFSVDYAVLDGNVERVLTRLMAYPHEAAKPASRRLLQQAAQGMLIKGEAGRFNETLMDLGATVCLPRKPHCGQCPFIKDCQAHALGKEEYYPVKRKTGKIPHYDVAVGLVRANVGGQERVLIAQRPYQALLGGFWEFPGGKREQGEALEATCRREIEEETGLKVNVGPLIAKVNHAYSHFKITLFAFDCTLEKSTPASSAKPLDQHLQVKWVRRQDLQRYAMPKANRNVLEALEKRNPSTLRHRPKKGF